ncbi:hypothetical protein [Maribacter sp. 2210JD10-5]|uniref:hypothetical protein n=1 Tax=Maribacter sp. 2210JD10-5 TaxID=3386272 RepID=UPI0039BD90C5
MDISKLGTSNFIIYGLPLVVIISSLSIAISPLLDYYPDIAIGITYDLILTAPLLFLYLSRKSRRSKLQVVPFFMIGIVLSSFLLPKSQHEHLNYIKTYLFPLLELTIFCTLVFKIHKGVKVFKSNTRSEMDFQEICAESVEESLGNSKFTSLFTSEITMLYYAFLTWRKKKFSCTTFTNYKENAAIALSIAFILIILIETISFHMVLVQWSNILAWILTATSIYTVLMIFAHIKALILNPSLLTAKQLILKNGLISRTKIALKNIEEVRLCNKEIPSTKVLKVGNLGLHKNTSNHNIAIYFKQEQTIHKAYGKKEKCNVLLVHVDDKNIFFTKLSTLIVKDGTI